MLTDIIKFKCENRIKNILNIGFITTSSLYKGTIDNFNLWVSVDNSNLMTHFLGKVPLHHKLPVFSENVTQ